MKRKIYTFQEFITEAYQVILEGKDTGKIKELIKKIKESDPEAIKSLPAYEKVMGWFENEGPTKGKSLVDSDKMVEYLEYWFGDLSSETSNSSRRVVEGMDKLKDTKNVEKILKKCQKEYEKGEFDKYDIGLITKSAEEIGKEFSKLIKSGKEIKREFPEHTTTNPDKYPNRLGIIPFSVGLSEYFVRYEGKDIRSGNAKQFEAWYKELEKNGVNSIIKKIKNPKYHNTRAVSLDEDTKGKILEAFQKKAEDRGNDIAEATRISWYPTEAEDFEKTTKEKTLLEPEIITDNLMFPTNEKASKGFFPENKASIDDVPAEYKKDFADSMKEVKSSIDEANGEITKVVVKAVSSTSKVPTTYKSKKTGKDGNEGLADDRIQTIKDLALGVLKENNMDVNLTYDETGKLANNGPEWNDATRAEFKDRKIKGSAAEKAYEEKYGPFRYSGLEIQITYKIEIPKEEVREATAYEVIGDWKSHISWVKPTSPKKPKTTKVRVKRGGGLHPTKPSTKCYFKS